MRQERLSLVYALIEAITVLMSELLSEAIQCNGVRPVATGIILPTLRLPYGMIVAIE
jgi:hypothetical protein